MPHLSLYFLMCVVLPPQTREPAVASRNPALGACNGPIGSNGAMIGGAAALPMVREGKSAGG
jgi:hypothetical protein